MDTVALIKRIVRITNKFSSPNTILSKDELLKFVSQGFGGNNAGITLRTLQRDFDVIYDIFQIRIGYSRTRKGYCVIDRGIMAHEYERLLQSFELLSRIDDNALLSCVQAEHRLPPIGDLFYEILCAIRNRCIIEITYEHYRNANKLGVHILSPCLLKESQHRWYVIGYNDADELRVYALERIKGVNIFEHRKFKSKPIEEINQLFAESYGIWVDNKQEVEDIVIKYDKLDGSFVKSLPLHHTQRVLEENEDSVTIGLQLRITNDFVMALLARSRSIEIIKPTYLRQRIYKTLCDAIEKNRV